MEAYLNSKPYDFIKGVKIEAEMLKHAFIKDLETIEFDDALAALYHHFMPKLPRLVQYMDNNPKIKEITTLARIVDGVIIGYYPDFQNENAIFAEAVVVIIAMKYLHDMEITQ